MTAPIIQIYDASDTTLQSGVISTGLITAGSTFGPNTYHFWNEKGGVSAGPLSDAMIVPQAWNGSDWVTSGYPVIDEGWIQCQLNGVVNPGNDLTLTTQGGGYVPVSSFHPLRIGDIPRNCARVLNVKIAVPAGAADVSQNVRLGVLYNEQIFPLYMFASLASAGIVPDRINTTLRRLTSYQPITASGADTVTVARGTVAYDGDTFYHPQTTLTLNQTDVAAAPLAVGESYIAGIFYRGLSTVVATKGAKAVTPTRPAPTFATDLQIGYVTVTYQGGGTSIINQGNVDQSSIVFGEFSLWSGGGFNLMIGAGTALTLLDTLVTHADHSSIVLPPSATKFIYLVPDGTFTTSNQALFPPDYLGYVCLGQVTTNGVGITSIVTADIDLGVPIPYPVRPRAEKAITKWPMVLRFYGPLAVGTDVAWDVMPFNATLESWSAHFGTSGGGGGSTKLDINTRIVGGTLASAATTIFTSQATDDQRPIDGVSAGHEVTEFKTGQIISVDVDSVTATPPSNLVLILHFRRY